MIHNPIADDLFNLNTKLVITSYVGNGTYGEANACSISFERPPILVFYIGANTLNVSSYPRIENRNCVIPQLLTTEYQRGGLISSTDSTRNYGYIKISEDRKTISWYYDSGSVEGSALFPGYQFNENGYTYFWGAFI